MLHARKDYQARIQDTLPELEGGIPQDEPVFLLRAKDIVAPSVVGYWALSAQEAGADDNIVLAALKLAMTMREWQEKHGSKIPDLPGGDEA